MPGAHDLTDYHSFGHEPSANPASDSLPDPAPRPIASEAEIVLDRLQRNGSALAACECGSHNWLTPDGVYQLQPVAAHPPSSIRRLPTKTIVPLTCAACGLTKFYDHAVVAARAEPGRRY
jgi:hypothetical protein